MKLNTDGCFLLVTGYNAANMNRIVEDKILESNSIKFPGRSTDSELKFKKHFLNIFSAIVTKLSALATMVKLVSFVESQVQFNSFFELKFKYPLIFWIFYGHLTNNKVNTLYKRAFRLVYDDYQEMLLKFLQWNL